MMSVVRGDTGYDDDAVTMWDADLQTGALLFPWLALSWHIPKPTGWSAEIVHHSMSKGCATTESWLPKGHMSR